MLSSMFLNYNALGGPLQIRLSLCSKNAVLEISLRAILLRHTIYTDWLVLTKKNPVKINRIIIIR